MQCGKCCTEEICIFGDAFLDSPVPPCPALLFKKDEHGKVKAWCGLVGETHKFVPDEDVNEVREQLLKEFNFGSGCDY